MEAKNESEIDPSKSKAKKLPKDSKNKKKKCCEQGSEELRQVAEQSAKCVASCHMPFLEAVLQTRATEMMRIKACQANDVEACAKAMM